MRFALLQNNEVVEVIETIDQDLAVLASRYQIAIESDVAQVGWKFDGRVLNEN